MHGLGSVTLLPQAAPQNIAFSVSRPAFLLWIPDFAKLGTATHHSKSAVRRCRTGKAQKSLLAKKQRNRDCFPQTLLNSWLRPEGDD